MARTAQPSVLPARRKMTHKLRTEVTASPADVRILDGESGEVWQMWAIEGCTQSEIAAHFGITQGRVSQIVAKVRESIPQPDVKQIRNERLIQLRAISVPFARKALAGDDVSARTLVKILEREARILGYDAPVSLRQPLDSDIVRYILEMDEDVAEALS